MTDTKRITCYIIDDEQASINSLVKHIAKIPALQLVGTNIDSAAALVYLQTHPVDCAFVDINMRPLSGMEFAPLINSKVIFTTAHDSHVFGALANANTIDFLTKPIHFDRLMIAVKKIMDVFAMDHNQGEVTNKFQEGLPVKKPYGTEHLRFESIVYIKAASNYSVVHHDEERSVIPTPLNDLESLLPDDLFMRVHRSYIINKKKLIKAKYEEAELEGKIVVPIGRSYRGKFTS